MQIMICTYINILFSDVGCIVRVGTKRVHPFDSIVGPFRIERIVVMFDPFLDPLIEKVLCHNMSVADKSIVFNWKRLRVFKHRF